MPQRRSIKDSLSTKEIDFLNRPLVNVGKPTKRKVEPASKADNKPKQNVEVHASTKLSTTSNQKTNAAMKSVEQWVPLSTRVPKSLHKKLRRIAFERQETGIMPNSIQDMIVEATETWLKKETRSQR